MVCFLTALFVGSGVNSSSAASELGLIVLFQMAAVSAIGLTLLVGVFELAISFFKGDFRTIGYAVGGLALAISVPAIAIAIDANYPNAYDLRTEDMNRGRYVCLAMHNYESTFQTFPPIADGAGEGLSWRVHLLPFLDEQDLYERFKLDEAWNSPHNIQLLEEMPEIYKNVSAAGQPPKGKTLWLRPYGNGAFNSSIEDKVTFEKIQDNTSDTIMVLLADETSAVEWTRPLDYPFNPKDPAHGLRENRQLIVGFTDGSTGILILDVENSDDTLRAMFTRSGGEEVEH